MIYCIHWEFTLSVFALIDALTKHMAVEWGEHNVRVVGVSPGPIAETEGMRKLGQLCHDITALFLFDKLCAVY